MASGFGRVLNLVLSCFRARKSFLAVVIDVAKRIVIIGAGGHGSVVWDTIAEIRATALESILPVGWIDDTVSGSRYGIPVLGKLNDIVHVLAEDPMLQFFIALGDNAKRKSLALYLERHHIESPRLIHPRSAVSSSTDIGRGSLVVAGAVVNVGADIGRHCIVNSGAVVEHDCRIRDYVHIAPNATITGGVTIGEGSLVGAGATVLPGIKIGENVTVGAGSVVTKDIPDDTIVMGVPARVHK